jgi:hypothetical protein
VKKVINCLIVAVGFLISAQVLALIPTEGSEDQNISGFSDKKLALKIPLYAKSKPNLNPGELQKLERLTQLLQTCYDLGGELNQVSLIEASEIKRPIDEVRITIGDCLIYK